MSEIETKDQVRQFYNRVGWKEVSEGAYQNARYEDLRPVSQKYIQRCHLRVNRFLRPEGKYFLDVGSGPVQYPAYLTYSKNYTYRLCLDISIVALQEARKRLGEHGLFVVADAAHLPFKSDVFDGAVSLHAFHHLPQEDQFKAYEEVIRVLIPDHPAVIVNGWTESPFMRKFQGLVNFMERIGKGIQQVRRKERVQRKIISEAQKTEQVGTFIKKIDADTVREKLSGKMNIQIYCWRSVNVRFLRAVIHKALAGKAILKLLYSLEERYPKYFGENGQYPLIVISKGNAK